MRRGDGMKFLERRHQQMGRISEKHWMAGRLVLLAVCEREDGIGARGGGRFIAENSVTNRQKWESNCRRIFPPQLNESNTYTNVIANDTNLNEACAVN
jgi:hypothetical protein